MANMTAKVKSELIHELHSIFGDASDPYAARGAKEVANALDKKENVADWNKLKTTWDELNEMIHSKRPVRARDLERKSLKMINTANRMADKYCPDNWTKRDLNWPPE